MHSADQDVARTCVVRFLGADKRCLVDYDFFECSSFSAPRDVSHVMCVSGALFGSHPNRPVGKGKGECIVTETSATQQVRHEPTINVSSIHQVGAETDDMILLAKSQAQCLAPK